MHELTGKISGVSFSYATGKPLITLEINEKQSALAMVDNLRNAEKLSIKIGKFKKKRSLDANRYFWKILSEVAEVLKVNKNELYLKYVQECGPFKDFILTEHEAKTFRQAWSMIGTGWPTEQVDYDEDGERLVVRAYYGSSVYNSKQMARLIDLVVEDAKTLDIETMTPTELEQLKEGWRGWT